MPREKISTGKDWEAALPFGAGVVASGRILFTSGIVARDDRGVIAGDMRAQVRQTFANLDAILAAAGTSFAQVIKFTVFTTDIAGYMAVVDEARKHYQDRPASTVVEVAKLARPEMLIEAEAIALVE